MTSGSRSNSINPAALGAGVGLGPIVIVGIPVGNGIGVSVGITPPGVAVGIGPPEHCVELVQRETLQPEIVHVLV